MFGVSKTQQGVSWEMTNTDSPTVNNWGVQVTADAVIHTKGAYEQLITATTYDWYGFWLSCSNSAASAAATDILVDIAIGPNGSEQVILPDFMAGWAQAQGPVVYFIPLYVPRGSRVAARSQALISGDNVNVFVMGVTGNSGLPCPVFSMCDAYGIDAANSCGTLHTPGNSGAESTPGGIGAPTTRNYGGVLIGVSPTGTTVNAIGYEWDLVVGGQIRGTWYTTNTAAEVRQGPIPPAVSLVSVPAGTQLQVQADASGTAQAHTVAFYCFY